MRRIIFGILGLLGIVLGIALIAPFFLNVNDYKPQIIAKAKESLGREVTIQGKISLRLLPMPKLSLEEVGVGNIAGGTPKDLIHIQRLDVAVDLWPLLKKQIKIKTIELDHPDIFLEKLPNGQTNWTFAPPASSRGSETSPTSSASNFDVALDKVLIHHGSLVYHEKGKDTHVNEVNASINLDTLQGPYAVVGSFQTFGQDIKIDGKFGALGEAQDVALKVQVGESTANLDGKASISALTFKGNVKATADPKLLGGNNAKDKPSPLQAGPLKVDSAITADQNGITLNQAKFEIGSARPTGDLKIIAKEALQIQGNVKDLPGQGQCAFTLSPTPKGLVGSVNATVGKGKDLLTWLAIDTTSLPPEALGAFNASTLFTFGDAIQLTNLNLTVQGAKILGDISWQTQKGGSVVVADLQSPKIENVMKLMGVKDPKPLGLSKFKGNIRWNAASLNLTNLKGQLGPNFSFTGNVDVDQAGTKPKVKAALTLNSINVSTLMASRDSPYPTPQIILVSTKTPSSGSHWSNAPLDFSFLNKVDGYFEINASQLSQGEFVISHPKLVANLQNGRLVVKSLTGSIFDGSFVGNGHLSSSNDLHIHMVLKDANLKHLASHGTSIKIVGGKLFFSSDFTTRGSSLQGMIQNLSGPVTISAKDGMINGFDLQTLSQRLGSLQNPSSLLGLLNTTMGKGQTPFSSFKGDIVFKDGVGTIQSLNLTATSGQGQATGQIDLPRYQLDIHAEFRLTDHPKIPPFRMQLTGPIDNPSRNLDTGALQKFMVENVFKGVISKLGKGKLNAADILGSVLGGEKSPSQQPSNAPSPATQKPEQIVKDIFKGLF